VKHFWETIKREVEKISEIYSTNKSLCLTTQEKANLDDQLARTPCLCHICGKSVNRNEAVVDHCHLTGKLRGIAHNSCNLQYRLPHFVPIIFHNGSRYDFKLIIRDIIPEKDEEKEAAVEVEDVNSDEEEEEEEAGIDESESGSQQPRLRNKGDLSCINIIARTSENIISFEKPITEKLKARFIDSFAFMASSLDTLASNLPKDKMRNTRKEYPNERLFNLASQKGIFPYEYVTDFSKYEEPGLPSKESFYNSLSNQHISNEDYLMAEEVFSAFGCMNLGQYSDNYLKIDVLLLADIFEEFRDICLRNYKLDPAWHYSAPGLSWNAMLKSTGERIHLVTDYEMFLFLEEGVRGGFCQVSKCYVKANNPSLPNHNPAEQEKYIFYIDANNLYGFSMNLYLPSDNFQWLSPRHLTIFNELSIKNIPDDCNVGYIFEVDLEYPASLHEEHNDFPLCPEKIVTPTSCNIPKLIATLHDKNRYVVHYTYLKRALENGLRLQKIHRGISFTQKPWL